MEYRNSTPFHSLAFEAVDAQRQVFHVVVLRMTLDIQADGTLKVAGDQTPLLMTDELYGELNKSSVKQESDLAPYKPWCDVIVLGEACAPGPKPAKRFETGIRITRKGAPIVDKRVTVTGPRFWRKTVVGWRLTDPAPIRSLPLRYEYAYGGQCRVEAADSRAKQIKKKQRLSPEQRVQHPEGIEKAPVAHTCCDANPVGMGYVEDWYLKALKIKHLPAPQIESLRDPINKFGKFYEPQGLGVTGRAWAFRQQLCGTLDDAFIRSGHSLPRDFDFGYWNGAHPDLQVPWLEGDETIDLINIPIPDLRAERIDSQGNRITRLVLPGHNLCAEAIYPDRRMAALDFNVDTLTINAEQKTISLVYRLKVPLNPAIQSIEAQLLSSQEREVLMEHVDSVTQQVLQYQEAFR